MCAFSAFLKKIMLKYERIFYMISTEKLLLNFRKPQIQYVFGMSIVVAS